jgi:hypothetical protein
MKNNVQCTESKVLSCNTKHSLRLNKDRLLKKVQFSLQDLQQSGGLAAKNLVFLFYGIYTIKIERTTSKQALVAQWIARKTSNLEVAGSSPAWGAFLFAFYNNIFHCNHSIFDSICHTKTVSFKEK